MGAVRLSDAGIVGLCLRPVNAEHPCPQRRGRQQPEIQEWQQIGDSFRRGRVLFNPNLSTQTTMGTTRPFRQGMSGSRCLSAESLSLTNNDCGEYVVFKN
jgi:hypothetical protein